MVRRVSRLKSPLLSLSVRDIIRPSAVLVTPRLVLRLPKLRDANDFYAYARDPQVAQFELWETHKSVHETRWILRGMMKDNRQHGASVFAITETGINRMIGTIGFVRRDQRDQSAEIGFCLARDHWGQGLMTEAVAAFLRYAFLDCGIIRGEAQHDIRNPASGRVMQKAGMKAEGVMRERLYYKGFRADVALYAALADEWLAAHP